VPVAHVAVRFSKLREMDVLTGAVTLGIYNEQGS